MKWVKVTAMAAGLPEEPRNFDGETEESDDLFRDIESLREDDSRGRDAVIEPQESAEEVVEVMSVIEEHSEVDEEEEADLTSFSFDDPSAGIVHVMTGVETEDRGGFDETSDSEDEVIPAFWKCCR